MSRRLLAALAAVAALGLHTAAAQDTTPPPCAAFVLVDAEHNQLCSGDGGLTWWNSEGLQRVDTVSAVPDDLSQVPLAVATDVVPEATEVVSPTVVPALAVVVSVELPASLPCCLTPIPVIGTAEVRPGPSPSPGLAPSPAASPVP